MLIMPPWCWGSDSLYLDMKDGTGSSSAPVKGTSAAGGASGYQYIPRECEYASFFPDGPRPFYRQYNGIGQPDSRELRECASGRDSRLTSSALTVSDGGRLHVKGGLETDGGVTLDGGNPSG
ncbi:peptidase S6, IgA endopeptidase from phage origin [Escherichia coli]|uniref:Peptidase S6, IgA endopeptidase from phage origin n=1 Tax=Escherichia coli TaxID=562 RepID=A0A377D3U2_ECOLX|nr:peptidase S6, IgA endopeptidase from phage origin [Escherichia coli]